MNLPGDDAMQRNIRQVSREQALKQLRSLLDEEREKEVLLAKTLRYFFRYGALILLLGLAAHLTGVI